MMITIDPNELAVASETLRSCAIESADIGSQLSACACCAMPPELQHVVDQLVVAVDRALDSVSARLDAQAVDLSARAQIAATDSLAAAGAVGVDTSVAFGGATADGWSADAASWMAPMTVGASGGFGGVDTGSWMGPMAVGASDGFDGVDAGSWMAPMAVGASGGFGVDTGSWTVPMTVDATSGGFPVGTGSWMDGMAAAATNSLGFPVVDKADWMNSISGGGGSNGAVINSIVTGADQNRIAMNLGAMGDDISGHTTAPSRLDLENHYGRQLTNGEIETISPNTLDHPARSLTS